MILTDRSRYVAGLGHCAMARYLRYHHLGTGIQKQGTYLPLATGTWVHKGLEGVLKDALNGTEGDVQKHASAAVGSYQQEVKDRGFAGLGSEDEAPDWIMQEQSWLIETLVYGWKRVMLPILLENYEIVAVEHEETAILNCTCPQHGNLDPTLHVNCSGVCLMSRPDFVMRAKTGAFAGQLGIHDFKTTSYLNERFAEEFRSSVQTMSGTLGVETRLEEPVTHFCIWPLLKGVRRPFTRKDQRTGARQMSDLCYAKLTAPMPPLLDSWSLDTGGYWIDKTPLWTAGISAYDLVNKVFSEGQLNPMFGLIGPFERQKGILDGYLSGLVGEEERWDGVVSSLKSLNLPWESAEFQRALFYMIPPSWNCNGDYGKPCQFIPICHRHPGWKKPLDSGYVPRQPHHELEEDLG